MLRECQWLLTPMHRKKKRQEKKTDESEEATWTRFECQWTQVHQILNVNIIHQKKRWLSGELSNKCWVCVLISLNPVLTTTVNSALVEWNQYYSTKLCEEPTGCLLKVVLIGYFLEKGCQHKISMCELWNRGSCVFDQLWLSLQIRSFNSLGLLNNKKNFYCVNTKWICTKTCHLYVWK